MKSNISKFVAGALAIATILGVAVYNNMSSVPVYESKAHTNVVNVINN